MTAGFCRRGFTLIELLVVISILGLLSAIIVPVARNARVVSRRAKCLSNLHSIGQALQNYLSENRDTYPWAAEMRSVDRLLADLQGRKPLPALSDVLRLHAGNSREVFACPADHRLLDPGSSESDALLSEEFPSTTTYFATEGLSYEWRSQYNGKQPNRDIFTDREGLKLSPAVAPLLFDFQPWHGDPGDKGSVCFLFADLHAAPDDYEDESAD
jgi:prepilin-type N-terminal cleavage/methylation domain-containing protein